MLIEDADGASQWAVRRLLLERGDLDVAACGGPTHLPGGRCPMVTDGHCELAEGADVILNNFGVGAAPTQALLASQRGTTQGPAIIVEITRPKAREYAPELAGFRLLLEPASPSAILQAVDAAVRDIEEGRPTSHGAEVGHLVSVCDQVAIPFEEVVARLQRADAADLVRAALDAPEDQREPHTSIDCTPFLPYGCAVARAGLTWGSAAPLGDGVPSATLTVLRVQSGRAPTTELLLAFRVPADGDPETLALAKAFLDRLTTRLLSAA